MAKKVVKHRPKVLIDADTGDEIIVFLRRGRYYAFLRDRETKRFIKMLRVIRVTGIGCVDYVSPRKPYHNLYIDVNVSTDIKPIQVYELRKIEREIEREIRWKVEEKFGFRVAKMLEIIGIQYGSKPCGYSYPMYSWYMVWKHYTDIPKEESGSGVF